MASVTIPTVTWRERIVLKQASVEWVLTCLILLLSSFNEASLAIALGLSLVLLLQKETGAIKILFLLALRTIFNPGIAVGIDQAQWLKVIIIMGCTFYLLARYYRVESVCRRQKLAPIAGALLIWAFYSIVSSFLFSSIPITSMVRIFGYALVSLAVLIGVGITRLRFDWLTWAFRMMSTLLVLSLPMLISPIGYLRNGVAFQGLTNQPNMLGIVAVLFLALVLTLAQHGSLRRRVGIILWVALPVALIFLSASRTALFSAVFLFAVYGVTARVSLRAKALLLCLLGLLGVVFSNSNIVTSEIQDMVFKGNQSILFSRSEQLQDWWGKFQASPLFGVGFASPVLEDRTLALSLDFVIEPGNLLVAVLAYGGGVGFLLFALYVFRLWRAIQRERAGVLFIFLAPFLVSMGEMVFFSSNNIGAFLYLFLAVSTVGAMPRGRGIAGVQDGSSDVL